MRPTVLFCLLAFSGSLTLHVQSKVICGENQYTVTNGSSSYCFNCDKCHPGYGLYPACGQSLTYPLSNIDCKPCPNEMFSAKTDSAPCYPCQQCAKLEIVAAPCTRFSDRICNGTCQKGYFFAKKVPHICQQCSYCCFDGKDEEQPECIKQGLNATGRHCSARLDEQCGPHLSSSTAAVTTQTHPPSLTQSPTSLRLTSSPSHSTSPSTTAVANKGTAVTHLPTPHSPALAKLTSSTPRPTNHQVGNHPAVLVPSILSGLLFTVLAVTAMCYMHKRQKWKLRRNRTESILPDRSPVQGNYDNNTIEVLPQSEHVAYHPRVPALQNRAYAASTPSATPEVSPSGTPLQTDDEVEELPNVEVERNKRLSKRQSSKEPKSNVKKKDGTTENLVDPSVHVQAGNEGFNYQGEDRKDVGQSIPRRPSFEALKRKLSFSRDYQPLLQQDPDELQDTSKTKEKITVDVVGTGVKQNNISQVNTRLSTNVQELPYHVRGQVCKMLNIKRDLEFDDFRMLAEKAGLGKDKINNVEQTENSPTHAILTEWSIKNSEATVGKLIEMLKDKGLERMDVVKVLEDWVNEK